MHRKSLRTAVAALTVGLALAGAAATATAEPRPLEPHSPAPAQVADSGSSISPVTITSLLRSLAVAVGSAEPCDYTKFPSNCAF
ncbi:hypothetical protein ACFVAV_26315 [Nocardia sp. NPDC057663]|uniref:hypothetical protein n=1 Tax=Nocardia sp. NPDC057663 TaxID=3346201 RepID=UPI00367068B5